MKPQIVSAFIKELGKLELSAPAANSAVFVQGSGWNTRRYYRKFYRDTARFPLLIAMRHKEGFMYWPIGKIQNISADFFRRYWKKSGLLRILQRRFDAYAASIDALYCTSTSAAIARMNRQKFTHIAKEAIRLTWEMNALSFPSIYFEKELCRRILNEVGEKMTERLFNEAWKRGAESVNPSFNARQRRYALGLLYSGLSWSSIGEKCQYFGAHYHRVAETRETEARLRKIYGGLSPSVIRRAMRIHDVGVQKRQRDYRHWLDIHPVPARKLAEYVQAVINLRDVRKDLIGKTLAILFRVAQRLFDEAGISHALIPYVQQEELYRGAKYLRRVRKNLAARPRGFVLFVRDDGSTRVLNGCFSAVKRSLDAHYNASLPMALNQRVYGATGAPGCAKGKAHIVRNILIDGQKLHTGGILVTGMTRPEFLPLMKRAKAIITDEGGITCHAAIVARELGIPCIIGTKIATQVLKDGDLVEVDADRGTVKILKKA